MKVSEILKEGYIDDLTADLDNILANAKARGLSSVKTDQVVKTLIDMGYSVDKSSIFSALSLSPFAHNANSDIVNLSPDGDVPEDETKDFDQEESAEAVRGMALDAANKTVR